MLRSRVINAFGLDVHRRGAGDRAGHQVPRRRLDRDPGDGLLLHAHARHPRPLRQRRGRSSRPTTRTRSCPTRVHAIVLVSKLHKPTLRALAFAKATRPNVLEAVYVSTSPDDTNRLLEEWDERSIDVPLKVLHSPYREMVRPIVEYATEIRQANPRGVVAVYIPEYVVGRWWEQLLHNQTALRLKGRLLFTPGVMVTSVPYQLRSSQIARERELREDFRVRPATCAAARSTARRAPATCTAESRRRRPGPAATAGGPASGSGTTSWSARSRTAATASPGCRSPRAGWSSSGTRCPASGSSSRSPRAPTATGSGAATPSRCSSPSPDRVAAALPVRRPGPLRRLRLPARRARAPAGAQGGRRPRAAVPAGRARARRDRRGGARRRRTGCAGGPGSGTSTCPTAGGGCASTARTTSSRSTTA